MFVDEADEVFRHQGILPFHAPQDSEFDSDIESLRHCGERRFGTADFRVLIIGHTADDVREMILRLTERRSLDLDIPNLASPPQEARLVKGKRLKEQLSFLRLLGI